MICAQLESGTVTNIIIVEDPTLLSPSIIDVTDTDPRPEIGWVLVNSVLKNPAAEAPVVSAPTQCGSIILTEASGGMLVKAEGDLLLIGCLSFPLEWSKAAITDLIQNNAPCAGVVQACRTGVVHGDFLITWEDLQSIQNYLGALGV